MPDHAHHPDNDPFAAPSPANQNGAFSGASGPHNGAGAPVPHPPLSGPGSEPRGNALAIVVILGLALVALTAVVAAGYFVWQGVQSASESSSNGTGETAFNDDSDDADEGFMGEFAPEETPYPAELEDLDALTADPGDTFESGYESFQVGQDVAAGVYVAFNAGTGDSGSDDYCRWTVSAKENIGDGGYYALGDGDGGSAMMLAPEGYWVRTNPACGTWEAIDPATAFTGASGTQVAEGSFFVGRDVLPGTYVSTEQVGRESSCFAEVISHFGFIGDSNYGDYVMGRGGTLVLELEEGEVVASRDCPPLELTDLDSVLDARAGAQSMSNGYWLVGLDIEAGTYQGPLEIEEDRIFCSATVWADHRGRENYSPLDDVYYSEGDEPETVTVEPGQLVEVSGCGDWELVKR